MNDGIALQVNLVDGKYGEVAALVRRAFAITHNHRTGPLPCRKLLVSVVETNASTVGGICWASPGQARITIRVDTVTREHCRFGRSELPKQDVLCRNWREALVYLAGHEFNHLWDCPKAAERTPEEIAFEELPAHLAGRRAFLDYRKRLRK